MSLNFKNGRGALASAVLLATAAAAQNTVYVTDLPLYSSLAHCAAFGVAKPIQDLTYYGDCPPAVTALQECVCGDAGRYSSASSTMSGIISVTCGATASEDQASAATVLRQYCSQDWTEAAFPTPTQTVSSYIHELPYYSQLAPCAQAAVSMVARANTEQYCPPQPTALAPCICTKNQNSLRVSASLNTVVAAGCSSNPADVSSAQLLLSAYCNLVTLDPSAAAAAAPTTTPPPGDMSYYITDLPEYAALDSCAQVAVSLGVMFQTRSLCPGGEIAGSGGDGYGNGAGPQALASCACLKESVSLRVVSSTVSSDVYQRCSTDVMRNLDEAESVVGYYCSAARGEVVATGVETGGFSGMEPTETGISNDQDGEDDDDDDDCEGEDGVSAGVIAGAVVGAVVGALIIFGCVFCCMRRRRRGRQANKGKGRSEEVGDSSELVNQRPREPFVNEAPPPYEEETSRPADSKKG